MNWEAIKHIYRRVLICKDKFEYLDKNKYKLISFYPTGEKHWEVEFEDGQKREKWIGWYKNGWKRHEQEYQDGTQVKWISWYKDGWKHHEEEYQNRKQII